MELFKSGLKSVLGAPQPGSQPTGAETIERLVERVMSSTLLDDRRDAVRALKALSKKFRVEVGAQAMDALIRVLEMDRNVSEIVGYALDTLCNVVAPEPSEDDETAQNDEPDDLGVQFTEIYIKRPENVPLLLSLLDEYDFHVRWPAVRLLTSLLVNKQRELQECVLVSPMGVSKLMDLLSESREVIRNDALLLLINLTRSNANIQKIVAFENAFERILDIVSEEGNAEGGIVVEDCLQLLLNLLKNNTSNQNFFKEGCFIQRMTPFLDVHESTATTSSEEGHHNDTGWSAQKVSNVHLMLQIVRTLVSPSNPLQVTSSCQKVMNGCNLLEQLCSILMASGVPADILTETINTVAEVIRGNHANQEYFATVTAPCNPPRPAIVVLLMSMVNEKQPFVLRCAVLYCFQCFLHKNELGQAQIVQTLLPTSAEAGTMSAGQLLCSGLFSSDSLSNWFVAVGLMHSLVESTAQREHLLRVQLVTGSGQPPVFLIQQVTSILIQGGKVQTRIGILMLLSMWLSHCPPAVAHFLNIPTNVPYLTSQAGLFEGDDHEVLVQGLCALLLGICVQFNDDSVPSFSKDMLTQLIAKRVGIEAFFDKLGSISKHESYSRVAQKPQLKYHHPNDVLFDYEFCRLFKSLEGVIVKAVTPKSMDSLLNGPETHLTEAEHSLLQQYKGLIRDQDQQLSELRQKLDDLQIEHGKTVTQIDEMNSTVQQLKDQNALLKAERGSVNQPDGSENVIALKTRVENLQRELEELRLQPRNLTTAESNLSNGETNEDVQRLSATLAEGERRIAELQCHNEELQLQLTTRQIADLPLSDSSNAEAIQQLESEKSNLLKKLDEATFTINVLENKSSKLETERDRLHGELDAVTKEQDDLLVLLTEQDTKLSSYKERLIQLGEKVLDDDEVEIDVENVDLDINVNSENID